ncbi:MAG: hypothetical protein A2521_10565 [Deltaproteobacteria bacterium RIFOXYD12_FULL_57_12]|nr:MAG: hypothetical protein A2521_10565 [Deltaproteobacteria bacterium RIFOXYD12_FULL_57_12]
MITERGFSLIEVLVALFILIFAVLGTMGLLTSNISNTRFAAQITEATTLAQDRLEALKAKPFDDIISANYPAQTALDVNGVNGAGVYTRTTTIDTSVANLKQVAVTVLWAYGGTHTVVLRTVISN